MLLSRLQSLISGIYDVSIAHDVYDFLVTDRGQLPAAAPTSESDEELFVTEAAGEGGEVGVSLYLDPALLERLKVADPLVRLHDGNVADYWTALEGVSHFLYLAWNAGHDRPVSLLELEMQAEVDKYVSSYWLMREQFPGRFPAELMNVLFERTRIDSRLARGRESLYREATRYAQKFCRRLEQSLRGARRESDEEVLAELRRFYRLTNLRTLAHIERSASGAPHAPHGEGRNAAAWTECERAMRAQQAATHEAHRPSASRRRVTQLLTDLVLRLLLFPLTHHLDPLRQLAQVCAGRGAFLLWLEHSVARVRVKAHRLGFDGQLTGMQR